MKLNEILEAAKNVLRFRHLSYRTEQAYLHWIQRYARWCVDHPSGDHANKLRNYLTHLATDRDVSVSTQSQALNALVFLYKWVLKIDLGDKAELERLCAADGVAMFSKYVVAPAEVGL